MAFPHDGKKFEIGQSGNPDGRPVGAKTRSTLFKKWLETAYTFDDPTDPDQARQVVGTIEDAVVLGLLSKAAAGDANAAREVLDSAYGKQTAAVDVTTNGESLNDTNAARAALLSRLAGDQE